MTHPPQALELLRWFRDNWTQERVLEIRRLIPEHLRLYVAYCEHEGWLSPNALVNLTDLGRLQLIMPPTEQIPTQKHNNPFAKKQVNARMLEKILADPACKGWTCKEFAQYLKCSEPSVVATKAWKELEWFRNEQAANYAKDRHHKPTHRPRRD
jgi:hypothetical protein